MEPPFVSVISTVCPWRTCRIGPGAPWPSNAHVLYFTPGAISTTMSLRVMWIFTRSPGGTAGRVASYAACALASASAFAPVAPAKLCSGRLWLAVAPCDEWSWTGVAVAPSPAAARASSRASSAACIATTDAMASVPTAIPSSNTTTFQTALDAPPSPCSRRGAGIDAG
jgi:hypothetical protein